MTHRKSTSRLRNADRLKDEVYRQMFRLEAHIPGADLELSIALLRGWIAPCPESEHTQLQEWLKKISPICIQMIEVQRGRNTLTNLFDEC